LQQVTFGEEYITDLTFDPGNATLITGAQTGSGSITKGGGSISLTGIGSLILLSLIPAMYPRRRRTRVIEISSGNPG
jgi:hypothetical protein